MKKYLYIALASLMFVAMTSCSYVYSGMHTDSSLNGDSWYTTNTWAFGLVWGTHVYYCPAPTGKGPVTCIEAIMHEGGSGAAMDAGFGAPAQPAQPAQPAYGAPAQPAQPGFGQPAQPGYGAPAQPAGGYQPQPAPPAPEPAPAPPPPGY